MALCKRAQRGDVAARNRLVETSLGMLWGMVRAVRLARGMALEDLVGAGAIGLMKAIEKFDPRRGVKFTSYAAYWVRSKIDHELTTWRFGKTSDWHRRAVKDEYLAGLERGETEEQAVAGARSAGGLHCRPEIVRQIIAALTHHEVSLEKRVYQDGIRVSMVECLPSSDPGPLRALLDDEQQRRVRRVLFRFRATLTPIQVQILDRRILGDEETLQEVGEDQGCSRENIRQHEVKLRTRLRAELTRAGLGPEASALPLAS